MVLSRIWTSLSSLALRCKYKPYSTYCLAAAQRLSLTWWLLFKRERYLWFFFWRALEKKTAFRPVVWYNKIRERGGQGDLKTSPRSPSSSFLLLPPPSNNHHVKRSFEKQSDWLRSNHSNYIVLRVTGPKHLMKYSSSMMHCGWLIRESIRL